jgi:hypothetical protein
MGLEPHNCRLGDAQLSGSVPLSRPDCSAQGKNAYADLGAESLRRRRCQNDLGGSALSCYHSKKIKSEFLLVDPIPYRPSDQDRGRARICYTLTRYNYKSVRFVADHSTFKEPEVGCGADRAFEKFNVTQVNLSLCN